MVNPGRSVRFASFAAASSSMVVVASSGEATSRRTAFSVPFQHPRWGWSLCPSALSDAPMSSLACSPLGRLAAGETEGEAAQAIVQLGRCRPESGFQTEGPLVGGHEGSQCESRLPVHYLLHVFLSADSALDPSPFHQFRSEQSDRQGQGTCCPDPPAVLW